jgi:hypothetical protein
VIEIVHNITRREEYFGFGIRIWVRALTEVPGFDACKSCSRRQASTGRIDEETVNITCVKNDSQLAALLADKENAQKRLAADAPRDHPTLIQATDKISVNRWPPDQSRFKKRPRTVNTLTVGLATKLIFQNAIAPIVD